MPKKNRKVYKVGNRFVVKENGKVKIVTKKKQTETDKSANSNKKHIPPVTQSIKVSTEKTPDIKVENYNSSISLGEEAVSNAVKPVNKNQRKKLLIIISLLATAILALVIILTLSLYVFRAPSGLSLKDNMLTWNAVDDVKYYILNIDGTEYKTESTSYDVSSLFPEKHSAKVSAIKNSNSQTRFSKSYAFEIPKQEIKVSEISGLTFSKTYDGGTNYFEELKLGEHYSIYLAQLKYGTDVDITITDIKFNTSDVESANKITVNYSSVLKGADAHNYKLASGSFSYDAQILPKQIQVSPSAIVKQFADKDNLYEDITDKELGKTVTVKYNRQTGESLGFYDILGVVSENPNYNAVLEDNSGKAKFEITQRVINVVSAEDAFVSKVYDGNADYSVDNLNSSFYEIENLVGGYDAEIIITNAAFNSMNVEEVNTLVVYFSQDLIDSNGVYKTVKSSFEVPAKILPKKISVVPDNFSKEFGYEDNIVQSFTDDELAQSFDVSFLRTSGEGIGTYDILSAQSLSHNYEAELIDGSGRDKFKIEKRTVSVVPTDVALFKNYDGTVLFNGVIEKNVHYLLPGEIEGYDVDIVILSARFDYPDVEEATELIVEIGTSLVDANNVYRLAESKVNLVAEINRKQIEVEPDLYKKQYGDIDSLSAFYFDMDTNTSIPLEYSRIQGEAVGLYDIVSAESLNSNYEFRVINSENKFSITKRTISVSATEVTSTKVFDNTDTCNLVFENGVHYLFNNTVFNEVPDILYTKKFNTSEVTADSIILNISALTDYSDRYLLENNTVFLPARIIRKQVTVEPQNYSIQYGDTDYLRQSYTDEILGLKFGVTFIREDGETVGDYDIVSSVADNQNYEIIVVNGTGKFKILPRVLGVEIIDSSTFNKIYDGTTDCNLPITQGVHYKLTNLNGGSSVTLNIKSQEFNSKNVAEATQVIVSYTAILDGADGSQFITTDGTMAFDAVISPRPITVVPDQFSKDYLTDFLPEQNVVDEITGEIIPVTFISSAGVNHINTECGAYDITEVNWVDTNHIFTVADGAGIGKFVINRINLVITANNRNAIYNTHGQSINQPSSLPERTLNLVYKLSDADDSAFSADMPVNAGMYTARVVFDGDRNYLPQYVDKTLFIDRAESVITNTTPTDYVYDGNIKPLTATLNHSEAALLYSRNDYVDAGTYNYIMISVPQTQNYKAASIIVSLNIERCIKYNVDMVYPTAGPITYGQYLYSSVLSGGNPLGSFSWETPDIQPVVADKKFIVKFTPFDTVNYDWTDVDMQRYVDITVNKFVVTSLPFPTATGVIYTNALSTSTLVGTSPYGTFAWQNASFVPGASGYYNVVFTPYDEVNNDFSKITKIQQVYVLVSYLTHFQTNGGSEIESKIVSEIKSEPFTYREGYVFDGWFLDETLLQKATFPLKITSETILYAGWYSEGLIFLKHDGYYSVKLDSTTIESSIYIPSEYRGLPVTAIESNGFKNCAALEVVVIPQSVVSIGHYAFVGCVNLTFVQLIGSIEDINFGIDWIDTGYPYGTDVWFGAEACPDCDGTLDFHQPGCEFNSDNNQRK